MSYTFAVENGADNFAEVEPLYRQHYAEMERRLAGQGIAVDPFDMQVTEYFAYWRSGMLVNYTARHDGKVVGYANIYVVKSMHTGRRIAQEDAIYVLPEHRNGTGRLLSKFILADLRTRGVKKLGVIALTDLRVSKLWQRMGFKHTGHAMTYTF
jgi:GNAT superfamily N-acetyltransferase